MEVALWLLVPQLALAGYGDAIGGHPSPEERELFAWANAARAAPEAFEEQYRIGGCTWDDFSPDEQSPTHPLRWNPDLGEAARLHSEDMRDNDVFGHVGSDGSTLRERLWFFDGTVGENVASGYPEPELATLAGWMCSPSHREILTMDLWDELGTGTSDVFYTQDFGDSWAPPRPVSMAAHVREGDDTVVLADWWSADGQAPDRFEVVVDGVAYPLGLLWGAQGQGTFATPLTLDGACHRYHVEAERNGVVTRFPEAGAYGWGDCAWDDPIAAWSALRVERTGLGEPIPGVPSDPAFGLEEEAVARVETTLGTRHAPSSLGCDLPETPYAALLLAAVSAAGARPRCRARPSRPARTRTPRR